MFHPEHFPPETWSRHKQNGYKLRKFLPLSSQRISEMDAETFLREGRSFFMTSPDINPNEESCLLAKVFSPDGRSACLWMDRDYFEIFIRDTGGTDTAAYWQFCYTFRDFRQDELWSNMVMLLCQREVLPTNQ